MAVLLPAGEVRDIDILTTCNKISIILILELINDFKKQSIRTSFGIRDPETILKQVQHRTHGDMEG